MVKNTIIHIFLLWTFFEILLRLGFRINFRISWNFVRVKLFSLLHTFLNKLFVLLMHLFMNFFNMLEIFLIFLNLFLYHILFCFLGRNIFVLELLYFHFSLSFELFLHHLDSPLLLFFLLLFVQQKLNLFWKIINVNYLKVRKRLFSFTMPRVHTCRQAQSIY